MAEITELLAQARGGDAAADQLLYGMVYDRLHALASGQLRGDQRLAQTTSLVHEAYLRMALPATLAAANRAHFFAIAATAMRQIVIDRARAAKADKRGGGALQVSLSQAEGVMDLNDPVAILRVDDALVQLREVDARLALVVELKVFGGMDGAEIGMALDVSERTVKRYWRQARALLIAALA
jgi:RNA polymerase sigma factor (TIGR02999 family)